MVKECTKEIAQYRVNRGHGVSEDYMILGKCMHFVYYVLDKSSNKLVLYKAKTLTFHNTFFCSKYTKKVFYITNFEEKAHPAEVSYIRLRLFPETTSMLF